MANMAKGRSTKNASSDEKCNEKEYMEGRGDKAKSVIRGAFLNKREKVRSPKILKTKTSRDYRRQATKEDDNIKDN
ncbi:hypothetical protein F2Q68_00016140 [Brassica cretica]|uniref:Uncharacterized protein n=1 Tax=Brassica cretica TaxID=69181 RepID=A0A8S9HNU0_BRACR|nr:hypothetical protein F2Q68_00016140 [Brassica cretica]KAF3584657.1 hypothetical protein F2Q69_00029979 [Brassica cretica]